MHFHVPEIYTALRRDFNVDITPKAVVSTPSLSLLIYRHKFLKINIPILKRNLDSLIRPSYFGGSSDYFYEYGENLKYYDINSLYPFAMLNDMPLIFERDVPGFLVELDKFFGFLEVIVECPQDIKTPLLLHNRNGKIIHPTGTWQGTYFSEELKAAMKHGYTIKEIIVGYEFKREANLFKDYVNHFYEVKKAATINKDITMRSISKLHRLKAHYMVCSDVS